MSKNKDPSKKRKPFTDVNGALLKFCQHVEVLNGVGHGYVIIAKVIHVGSIESVVEYQKGGRIISIENKKLRIKF